VLYRLTCTVPVLLRAGIIRNVNKMEETLKFLRSDDTEEGKEEVFEMNHIATAMQKMATLLRIGFGDAGRISTFDIDCH
jgi:hypothetical protein